MAVAEKISNTERLAGNVEEAVSRIPGNRDIREKALASFVRQGLPGKKNEEYRYSLPDKLFKEALAIGREAVENIDTRKYLVEGLNAHLAVVVNGRFSESLSRIGELPKGVIVSSLSKALEKKNEAATRHYARYADVDSDPFVALNTSLALDGVFVYVPANAALLQPIHILNITTAEEPVLLSNRNLVVAEKNAVVGIVESFESVHANAAIVSNVLTEISVSENARVQYYKIQNEGVANQVNTTQVLQEANSHFDTNTVTLSGSWIRNNLNIVANGKNCETHLNGLYIVKGTQHVDNHTLVDHRIPHCQSNQLYKGILDEKSTGVFNGKIFVRKDAQKTNAYQSSKNILLSDHATINTKPQLEIYADDVKCSHGSSTGQIDPDAMFYLRSRGLGEDSAKKLLMYAFAADVLNTIRIEALRAYLDDLVSKRLNT